jgi:hypothetical protein
VPWERHSSSRRWARQSSVRRACRRRLPGRPRRLPHDRPPPPPPTRTAGVYVVSQPRAGAARSARAHRSAARRYIARRTGGPDGQTAPGLGGRERRPARRSPRSARSSSPLGPPSPGGPSALKPRHRSGSRAGRSRAADHAGRGSAYPRRRSGGDAGQKPRRRPRRPRQRESAPPIRAAVQGKAAPPTTGPRPSGRRVRGGVRSARPADRSRRSCGGRGRSSRARAAGPPRRIATARARLASRRGG